MELLDHNHLNSLIDLLGRESIEQVWINYQEDSAQKMEALLQAWEQQDFFVLEALSHSLKSASSNMALSRLADSLKQLEEASIAGDVARAKHIIQILPELYSISVKEMNLYFE